VEEADVFALFAAPRHPYTRGLLDSIPRIDAPITGEDTELEAIPGIVPDIHSLPQGCRFADRCFRVAARCHEGDPPLEEIEAGRRVACFFPLENPR
ncbi:MAG: ABC transporter ATP-binding protein, partial [Deltaproteobacteria bacterium]